MVTQHVHLETALVNITCIAYTNIRLSELQHVHALNIM